MWALLMINMQPLESIYNATEESKRAARAVILAHDANAIDIIEILGLEGITK